MGAGVLSPFTSPRVSCTAKNTPDITLVMSACMLGKHPTSQTWTFCDDSHPTIKLFYLALRWIISAY